MGITLSLYVQCISANRLNLLWGSFQKFSWANLSAAHKLRVQPVGKWGSSNKDHATVGRVRQLVYQRMGLLVTPSLVSFYSLAQTSIGT